MKITRPAIFSTILISTIIFLSFSEMELFSNGVSSDAPREQSVWITGHWINGKASMNPFIGSINDFPGVYFMYLPLFDTNSQVYTDYLNPGNLIPLLGSTVSWNADGSNLTVNLRPQAKWSDDTQVTSADVVFSMQAYIGLNKSAYGGLGIFYSELFNQIKSITATSLTEIVISLNLNYYYSEEVYEDLLIGKAPIVPMKVFQGKDDSFTNNWFFDDSLPTENKIVDGPYMPYSSSEDGSIAICIRDDNWWMAGLVDSYNSITWRIPEPKYLVSYIIPYYINSLDVLTSGQVDLFGQYVGDAGNLINSTSKIHTWVEGGGASGNEYFPLTSAMNEIVFNYNAGYPLDQTWFHKALAAAINYHDISDTAVSGYLKQASSSWLDADQPAMTKYYDSATAAKWKITPSKPSAEAYMQQGAYKGLDGSWYTLDAPIGEIWSVTNTTITAGMDQDFTHAGINLRLTGWSINCVNGWIDHMKAMEIISNDWHYVLNVTVTYGYQDYVTFIKNRDTRNFQMYYSSLGDRLDKTPLDFMQYFTSSSDPGRNVTCWYNPNFYNNLTLFSTSTSNTNKYAYMRNLQDILGQIMPAIPIAVNAYWYTYSNKYWVGWPNGNNEIDGKYTASNQYAYRSDYVPVTTHWTEDHFGHDLLILNNLVSTYQQISTTATTSTKTTTTSTPSITTTPTTTTHSLSSSSSQISVIKIITSVPFDLSGFIFCITMIIIYNNRKKIN